MNTAHQIPRVVRSLLIGYSVLAITGCGVQKPLGPCRRVVVRGVNPPGIAFFVAEGEMVDIGDPLVCEALREYFPGLGTGRVSFMGVNAAEVLRMEFYCTGREDPVVVHVRNFQFWNSSADRGYFSARSGLKEYLHALFFQPDIRTVPPSNRKATR